MSAEIVHLTTPQGKGRFIADGIKWEMPDGRSGWVDFAALVKHIRALPTTATHVRLTHDGGKPYRISADTMIDVMRDAMHEGFEKIDAEIAELKESPAYDTAGILARARIRQIEAALAAYENDIDLDEASARASCERRFHTPLNRAIGEYRYARDIPEYVDIRHADGSALKGNRTEALRMLLLTSAEDICGRIEGTIISHDGEGDEIEAPSVALKLIGRACQHRFRGSGLRGDHIWGDPGALRIHGLLEEVAGLADDPGEVQALRVRTRACSDRLLAVADDLDHEARRVTETFAKIRAAHLGKSDDGLPGADDPVISPFVQEAKAAHREDEPFYMHDLHKRSGRRARPATGWALAVRHGRQGERGAKGERGYTGLKGDKGEPGRDAQGDPGASIIEVRIIGTDLKMVLDNGEIVSAPLFDLIGRAANLAVLEVEKRLPALIEKATRP